MHILQLRFDGWVTELEDVKMMKNVNSEFSDGKVLACIIHVCVHTYTHMHKICLYTYIHIYTQTSFKLRIQRWKGAYMHNNNCVYTYIHTYIGDG